MVNVAKNKLYSTVVALIQFLVLSCVIISVLFPNERFINYFFSETSFFKGNLELISSFFTLIRYVLFISLAFNFLVGLFSRNRDSIKERLSKVLNRIKLMFTLLFAIYLIVLLLNIVFTYVLQSYKFNRLFESLLFILDIALNSTVIGFIVLTAIQIYPQFNFDFSRWFSLKTAFTKGKKKSLSSLIIVIGQIAVVIGILVSVITLSTGIGARKAIKQKLADFNGHVLIKELNSNTSFNSDSISIEQNFYPTFETIPEVKHIQAIATKSGIIRTKENFDGVVLKGVGTDFDKQRFEKFMTKGRFPTIADTVSQEVAISEKIARELNLDVDSSFLMAFIGNNSGKPTYRRFNITGLYRTDVKQFDDVFIYGDIKHVQRLNRWDSTKVGGFELFVDDIEKLPDYENQINRMIPYNLQAESATSIFSAIQNWIDVFNTNIAIILIVMMIVVVINMIMVLLILIIQRTTAIGLLKTFGTNTVNIQVIFLNYALYIMLPGLIIGNLLAFGLLGFQQTTNWLELPSPENYFLSTVPVWFNLEFLFWVGLVNLGILTISEIILLTSSSIIAKINPARTIKMG